MCPPGDPYYSYVNRLANRSILSGYPCGGAGEPCVAPNNRPYFRPNVTDVWAVGLDERGSTGNQSLVEHWDGTAWSAVPVPDVGGGASLLVAVAAISASDVWAVGGYYQGSPYQTLIEHWDGSAWSLVPGPSVGTNSYLTALAPVSSSDAWAVGGFYRGSPYQTQTLIEHWDGNIWGVVDSPQLDGSLSGVAAVSSTDVWAVGNRRDGDAYQ